MRKVVSAGMVQFYIKHGKSNLCCYGESTSCKDKDGNPIQSRGDDDAWLIRGCILIPAE